MTEQKPVAGDGNRTATWTIIGVLVGFSLPIFMCVCLMLTSLVGFGASLGTAGGASMAASGTTIVPRHISGPLTGPAVAVISVNGPIVSGEAPEFDLTGPTAVAASGNIARLIRQAARDSQVKAILLRVDSPGGSVIGSDEIYHALKQANKPVVVHMGALAASGGYYVSMAADHIVAHPDTLTGSIGVISEFTNIEGLYEKLGLKSTVIKSGEFKDFGNPTSPFTEEDRKLWQAVIDETYESFVRIIADNRGMTVEEVKRLADGRIYTGRQAYALKLVDQLGYFEDAVNEAASRGGITGEPRVIEYRRQTPFAQLFGMAVARTILVALGVPVERLNATPGVLEYR
ncbi:MAG: signal peptide peptidase SppA [Anaerolineae bacterium]|nr:signal peptide peptidase SppA [Candidatus Roseilinea sp.]MDW8450813.1 signal peptide peptidase SppA [Anaerolineae bacterium]